MAKKQLCKKCGGVPTHIKETDDEVERYECYKCKHLCLTQQGFSDDPDWQRDEDCTSTPKIKLTPEVKATYQFILQEFNRIEKAMEPLKKHFEYLKENGHI